MIKLCTLGLLCALSLSCIGQSNANHSINASKDMGLVDEQEYAIYASVLDQLFPAGMGIYSGAVEKIEYFESTAEFVIYENTDLSPRINVGDLSNLKDEQGQALESALVPNLIEMNKTSARLRDRIPLVGSYELVSQPYFERNELSRRFPGTPGVIHFSRVGFSRNLKQAIVAIAQYHEFLQGAGQVCLLERDGTTWKLRGSLLHWNNEI